MPQKSPSIPFKKLSEIASKEYDRKASPLHTFGRALVVREKAHEIAKGKKVDLTVIDHAALFLHAGYQNDPETAGLYDRPAVSASVAQRVLSEKGYSPQHIERVKSAIIFATRQGATPNTPEAKILRAAHLAPLAGLRKQSLVDYAKWKREVASQEGKLTEAEYRSRRVALLRHHAEHDGALMETFVPGFRDAVHANADLLQPRKRAVRRRE